MIENINNIFIKNFYNDFNNLFFFLNINKIKKKIFSINKKYNNIYLKKCILLNLKNKINNILYKFKNISKFIFFLNIIINNNKINFIKEYLKLKLEFIHNYILYIKIKKILKNKIDKKNCFLDINAGTGGLDAEDWVNLLYRQYLNFCKKKNFNISIIYKNLGEKNGIKTITLKILGKYAYGILKLENGVHRLIRKSPYNLNRHTSFASVYFYPIINKKLNINIKPKDINITTFKSSGPGGQSVNKTNSAVRIIHKQSGIKVECQNERSQYRNKILAFKILKLKLYKIYFQKKNKKIDDSKLDITWGKHIRSYIFDLSLIKDYRNNYKINNIKKILNGDIDCFIENNFKYKYKII